MRLALSGRAPYQSLPAAVAERGPVVTNATSWPSVLARERAAVVNVLIMRAFVQLRRTQLQYQRLRERIEDVAKKVEGHDDLLVQILDSLDELARAPLTSAREIGFRAR